MNTANEPAPFTGSVRRYIEAAAAQGRLRADIAAALCWEESRLDRVCRAHGICFAPSPVMDHHNSEQATSCAPRETPITRLRTHPSRASVAGFRPRRTNVRSNEMTVYLSLTPKDLERVKGLARQAQCSCSALVAGLVEATNDLNDWERLLGIKG